MQIKYAGVLDIVFVGICTSDDDQKVVQDCCQMRPSSPWCMLVDCRCLLLPPLCDDVVDVQIGKGGQLTLLIIAFIVAVLTASIDGDGTHATKKDEGSSVGIDGVKVARLGWD